MKLALILAAIVVLYLAGIVWLGGFLRRNADKHYPRPTRKSR